MPISSIPQFDPHDPGEDLEILRSTSPQLSEVIQTYTERGYAPAAVIEFARAQLNIFDLLSSNPDLATEYEKLKLNAQGPAKDLIKLREILVAKNYSYRDLEKGTISELGESQLPQDLLNIARLHVVPIYREYLSAIGWSHCSTMTEKLAQKIENNSKIIELAHHQTNHMNHYVLEYQASNGKAYIIDITFDQFAGSRVGPKIMESEAYFNLIESFNYRRV